MDSSAPTILPLWVQVPSTPSTLFSFIVFMLYLSCKKNEIWPIFLKKPTESELAKLYLDSCTLILPTYKVVSKCEVCIHSFA